MTTDARWMLYGATGYTGRILLDAAVERGHRPIIAGRSAEKLAPLAERYGLESVAFPLKDSASVAKILRDQGVSLVLNAAGPFTFTAAPMRTGCISAGAHYLDITGEINVFEDSFAADAAAKEAGVLLLSGVGFDIVPSDCLARFVAEQVPGAATLDIAINALAISADEIGLTAGTAKSLLEMLPNGSVMRRGGQLIPTDFGATQTHIRLPNGEFPAMAIPWGDVSTAYRTTGIPNITAYFATTPLQAQAARWFGVLLQTLARSERFRRWAGEVIDRSLPGPSEQTRLTTRSHIYARAAAPDGRQAEAWLETKEGYAFTVDSALLCVERALTAGLAGALTPALAFGADFVLEVPTTERRTTL